MLATMTVATHERKPKRRKRFSYTERIEIVIAVQSHLTGMSIREVAKILSVSVGKMHKLVALSMSWPEGKFLVKLAADRARTRAVPKGLRRP